MKSLLFTSLVCCAVAYLVYSQSADVRRWADSVTQGRAANWVETADGVKSGVTDEIDSGMEARGFETGPAPDTLPGVAFPGGGGGDTARFRNDLKLLTFRRRNSLIDLLYCSRLLRSIDDGSTCHGCHRSQVTRDSTIAARRHGGGGRGRSASRSRRRSDKRGALRSWFQFSVVFSFPDSEHKPPRSPPRLERAGDPTRPRGRPGGS